MTQHNKQEELVVRLRGRKYRDGTDSNPIVQLEVKHEGIASGLVFLGICIFFAAVFIGGQL